MDTDTFGPVVALCQFVTNNTCKYVVQLLLREIFEAMGTSKPKLVYTRFFFYHWVSMPATICQLPVAC